MIVARDWPLLLAFLSFALVGFGLVGWLADRGKLAGSGQPLVNFALALALGAQAAVAVNRKEWITASIFAALTLAAVLLAMSSWRRRVR